MKSYYIAYQVRGVFPDTLSLHSKTIDIHPLEWIKEQPLGKMIIITFWSFIDLEQIAGNNEVKQEKIEIAASRCFSLSQ